MYSYVWDRGIAAHLIGALSTRASANRCLLRPPPPLALPPPDSLTLSVHGCNIHYSDGGGLGWAGGGVFGL